MAENEGDKNAAHRIVVVGGSMGGIEALGNLLALLPSDFPASIFAVLHLHPRSPSILDRMLGKSTGLTVKFAEDGAVPQPSTVYIAPPDHHCNGAIYSDGDIPWPA